MRLLLILLITLNFIHAKKIALLIGNSDYTQKSLNNPTNDIDLLAEKLSHEKIGFTVYKRPNLSKSQMVQELKKFYAKVDANTIALIYFSGHGVHSSIDNKNYLIPIGGFSMLMNESQLSDVALSESYLLGSTAGAKFSILLLDACRNNEFAKVRGEKGLGLPNSTLGNDYIISYATDVGKTAEDGYKNSPYALALSRNLLGDYPIEEIFRKVRKEVSSKTNGKQNPLYKPAFNERLCLTGSCGQKVVQVVNDEENRRLREKIAMLERQQNSPVREVKPSVQETRRVDSSTNTSKWITPTNSVCTNNGGKIYKGVCQANWENAKKICSQSGGRLPSREDFHNVITACGGIADADNNQQWDKNKKNSSYQSCYKIKGFSDNDWYWTRESHEEYSSLAWFVRFLDGSDGWNYKTSNGYALCVR